MSEYFTIILNGQMPLVTAAIHDGHRLSGNLNRIATIGESDRLREEDPFTGLWTDLSDNRILVLHSRFEFDLNRPLETAMYLQPSDAWGLELWKTRPTEGMLEESRDKYRAFYENVREGLAGLVKKFGHVVIYDLHSYNHRRNGPEAPPEDPDLNPEINIGTATMNREFWSSLVDRFIADLRNYDFMGRRLDVRENVRFKGGYFPLWIHENFPDSCCCISIEIKKIFMDEWTGEPDRASISEIRNALWSTVPGVMEERSKIRTTGK